MTSTVAYVSIKKTYLFLSNHVQSINSVLLKTAIITFVDLKAGIFYSSIFHFFSQFQAERGTNLTSHLRLHVVNSDYVKTGEYSNTGGWR